jgi:hypothetical protein
MARGKLEIVLERTAVGRSAALIITRGGLRTRFSCSE